VRSRIPPRRLRAGRGLLFSLIVLLAAMTAACNGRFESFPFLLEDGSRVAMSESPGYGKNEEGILTPSEKISSTPVYRLARPAVALNEGDALALTYTSTIKSCRLTIFSAEARVWMQAALPPTSGFTTSLQIPVTKGGTIWGFQVSADSKEGSLTMSGAGLAPRSHGVSYLGEDGIALDGGISLKEMAPRVLDAGISADAWDRPPVNSSLVFIRLRQASAGADPLAEPEEIQVTFQGQGSQTRSFTVKAYPGQRIMELPIGVIGFVPRRVRVVLSESSAGETASAPLVSMLDLTSVEDAKPIPVDPGVILDYLPSAWRDHEFELFAWDRYPSVLIMDTRDYDVQDDFFKRLAFFVEKPGYAGTIPDEKELAGKHGWNAHDYQAEDLARFFSAAQKGGIALSPGETMLRRILMDNGVISQSDTGYQPGRGSVLSISRSSGTELRRLLLTHESFHGVFFSTPRYRDACFAAWKVLSTTEKEIWIDFMDMTDYDTANQYLIVNEFQSYLFQQPRGKVPAFQAATLSKLRSKFPRKSSIYKEFQKDYSDSFLRSFDPLDRALREAGGPPGGEPFLVQGG
jgi:hypothetical protein